MRYFSRKRKGVKSGDDPVHEPSPFNGTEASKETRYINTSTTPGPAGQVSCRTPFTLAAVETLQLPLTVRLSGLAELPHPAQWTMASQRCHMYIGMPHVHHAGTAGMDRLRYCHGSGIFFIDLNLMAVPPFSSTLLFASSPLINLRRPLARSCSTRVKTETLKLI